MTQTTSEGAMTRRALLGSGAAAAAALALPAGAQALTRRRPHHRRRRRPHRAAHLRRASYRPLVGQRFRVLGSRTRLRLVAVEDLSRRQPGGEDGFTLIFRAPRRAPLLGDHLPTLHHPRLGSFPLFLSPGVASREGQPYCAVINRTHA